MRMSMKPKNILCVFALIATASSVVGADQAPAQLVVPNPIIKVEQSGKSPTDDMPKVPAEVMNGVGLEKPIVAAEMSLQDVVVVPGINTIIPAALGHQNRIVTPFDEPEIQTVSEADIQVHQNVIYVAPTDDRPVTMYINPKGDQSVALSLTLAPQRIPPVQSNLTIRRVVAGAKQGGPVAADVSNRYSGTAKRWEQSQPYMETIRLIMRGLALGKVPQGYTMTQVTANTEVPMCRQGGLHFSFKGGQWLQGHNFNVYVGIARNEDGTPNIVDEASCSHPHLAAVSMWPRNVLEAGESTEIYVVTRVPPAGVNTADRPSLLGAM